MKNYTLLLTLLITLPLSAQIITVNEKRKPQKTAMTSEPKMSLLETPNDLKFAEQNGITIDNTNKTFSITDSNKFITNYPTIKKMIVIDTSGTYMYAYHHKNRKELLTKINDLEKQLKDEGKTASNPAKIAALEANLESKKQVLLQYDPLFDTLRAKAQRQLKAPANFTHWFPSSYRNWKYIFYDKFYGKNMQKDLFVGNNASLQISNSGTTVQSELVSSYFGPFRVSFGTIVANKSSSDETDTASNREAAEDETTSATQNELSEGLQLLQSGGGNVYLNIDYAVYATQTKFATFYTNLYGRASGLFSQMTNSVDTSTGNACTGINIYGSVAALDRSLVGFLNFNFAGYAGGSQYYQSLNLTDNKLFAFGQLNIGIDFKNAFRLTYTPFTLGSDESLRKISGTIGIQISSEMFKS
jgi:hypothetical protein